MFQLFNWWTRTKWSLLCSSIEKEDLDDIEQVVVVRGLCKVIRYVISLFILGQKVRETQKIIEYGSIIHHFGMTQQANVNLNSKVVLTIGISQWKGMFKMYSNKKLMKSRMCPCNIKKGPQNRCSFSLTTRLQGCSSNVRTVGDHEQVN